MSLFEQDRPFLDALGAKARAELLALGTPRDYEPGTLLLRERSGTSYVIAILDGWAAVTTGTERGNRLILALRGAGAIVGEMAALDRGTRSATVGALDRVRAVVLTGDRFRRYLAGHPAAGELVLRQLSNRLRGADAERRALASETVLQRLAARLVELADRTGRPGDGGTVIDLPQYDLAAAVGATREAVAKALRLLREQGVVRTAHRRLTIADPEPLRLLAAGRGEPPSPYV
ncbi:MULTISPECIES: Crp/Fnr family transcriptional regulator [unclassified Streptomyces]|uniref:Crp/Fnr family transcriptional regulator n=1 Tax=unclassified Streptomyces TaxID=2593676 RepID=UPI002E27DFF5|nr:Crp/Fnr family transcriptional regulator [Streptomyces sp. NBC_00223]